MQYANNGSLLSYLDQNINKLTWRDKLERLKDIANYLINIHLAGLVHCDLHGGNIVMHDTDLASDIYKTLPQCWDTDPDKRTDFGGTFTGL